MKTQNATGPPSLRSRNRSTSAEAEKLPKVIAEWSATPPAGVLLISGEQVGYLEPCGCTEGQLGGLGRRYDLVERLRAQGLAAGPDRPRAA